MTTRVGRGHGGGSRKCARAKWESGGTGAGSVGGAGWAACHNVMAVAYAANVRQGRGRTERAEGVRGGAPSADAALRLAIALWRAAATPIVPEGRGPSVRAGFREDDAVESPRCDDEHAASHAWRDAAEARVAGGRHRSERQRRRAFELVREVRSEGVPVTVLTFFNHAGGVAKTSTVRDIGYVLGEMGKRVLLIDVDPQANLTKWMGVEDDIALSQTIYPAVIGDPDMEEGTEDADVELTLPEPLHVHGVDLIPSHLNVAIVEREILSIFMGVMRLREAVRRLEGYDFVLLDPPPSLGQLSALAVVAADRVVVPLPTNRKGLDGIPTVIKMVREYRKAARELSIALFVLTQHDRRTRHDRESLEIIQSQLKAFAPISTPLNSRPAYYSDAQVEGVPIPLYAPGSIADEEIRVVTAELVAALGGSDDG